jgi:hypothetical protein
MEVLPSYKIVLVINSQHVSTQIRHRQVILEEYTNGDGIYINYKTNKISVKYNFVGSELIRHTYIRFYIRIRYTY